MFEVEVWLFFLVAGDNIEAVVRIFCGINLPTDYEAHIERWW